MVSVLAQVLEPLLAELELFQVESEVELAASEVAFQVELAALEEAFQVELTVWEAALEDFKLVYLSFLRTKFV